MRCNTDLSQEVIEEPFVVRDMKSVDPVVTDDGSL